MKSLLFLKNFKQSPALFGLFVASMVISISAAILLGREIRTEKEFELVSHTRNLSNSISAQIFERFADSQAFALNPHLIEALEMPNGKHAQGAENVLRQLITLYKVYQVSILSDISGNTIAIAFKNNVSINKSNEIDLRSMAHEISKQKMPTTIITDFSIDHPFKKILPTIPLQSFSSPIISLQGKIIGFVTNYADSFYLNREVQNAISNFATMNIPVISSSIYTTGGGLVFSLPINSLSISINQFPIERATNYGRSAFAKVIMHDKRLTGAPLWQIVLEVNRKEFFSSVILFQLFAFGLAGIFIALIMFFTRWLLKFQYDQQRKLSEALITAQETERVRISRELHDDLGQTCTALKISLLGIENKDSHQIKNISSSAQIILQELNESIRRISLELHPSLLENLGLIAAMKWKIQQFIDETLIKVTFEFDSEFDFNSLPQNYRSHIYRIFQESMNNVFKHACANTVSISLKKSVSSLNLLIRDDGIGFDTNQSRTSLGLNSIAERTRLMNGVLKVSSSERQGTIVECEIPLDKVIFDEKHINS